MRKQRKSTLQDKIFQFEDLLKNMQEKKQLFNIYTIESH